jgi:hypothetical protein
MPQTKWCIFLRLNKYLTVIFLFAIVLNPCYSSDSVLFGKAAVSDDGYYLTEETDVYFLKLRNGGELRLANSTKALLNEAERHLRVAEGSVGLKNAENDFFIETEHASGVANNDAIVVIKSVDGFERFCVLRGLIKMQHKKSGRAFSVGLGEEIAVSGEFCSCVYRYNDDLRYLWYWVEADKEPSLGKNKK